MLGRHIHDPLGLEGAPGSTPGLSLLDADTALAAEKQLRNVSGHLGLPGRPAMTGYEMHLGITQGPALAQPAVHLADGRSEGSLSPDGQIFATYCHGLFDHPAALSALLAWAGLEASTRVDYSARREADLDRLADAVDAALD